MVNFKNWFRGTYSEDRDICYFSTNLSDDSYWSDIIMLLTYIGQRTSTAKRRANDEKSNGRWRMHVKKCGGWQFKGLALLEGVSKRCSDYFEESLIRLFGQSLTGVSQISNGKPPMRFQPDSLGSVESDLKAASFLLLYSSYCDKDYYNVDMRPSKMIYVGNYIVDEEKWTEWKAMLNVDEVVAENLSLHAQIIEKDQELADKDQVIADQAQLIEELNRMLDDLNLLPHKRAKIE
ncbi:hypothetical protein M3Y97_00702500 [Aphelenchoides bicaudatus]|nr:hypothetical protein M3Y97_00702500 [Aphelenchoides bicaudatus]